MISFSYCFIILYWYIFIFNSGCFSNLRVLALNSCGITSWASVQLLEPHLPIIEELFLAGNALTDLPRLKAEQNYQDATGAMPSALLKGMQKYQLDMINLMLLLV